MAEDFTIEGINKFVRTLKRAQDEMAVEMRGVLKELSVKVRDKARDNAAEQGFTAPGKSGRGTGRLVKNIKSSVRSGTALVRETAVNDHGYGYPSVYEFGHSRWGHRPFIMPALDESEPEIEEAFNKLVDMIVARANNE